MSLDEQFAESQSRVKTLPERPSNDTLLQLYSFFKQGSVGDVSGKRPSMIDIKGRAKFDAWSKRKGMAQIEAKQGYVDLVKRLLAQ